MKKAILFICSLCCVLGGTFTSYASEMQTNELLIVEEEQTAEAIAPTIFVADTSQIYTYTIEKKFATCIDQRYLPFDFRKS